MFLEGELIINKDDPEICWLREQALGLGAKYDEPSESHRIITTVSNLFDHFRLQEISKYLDQHGLICFSLSEALCDSEFLKFGRMFGDLIIDNSPQQYVESDFILNLIQGVSRTTDPCFQPFAENYIAFHVEQSYLPPSKRPKYIILMCLQAPLSNMGGQTVFSIFDKVQEQLSRETQSKLSRTHYNNPSSPAFMSFKDRNVIFSFRDYCDEPIKWVYTGSDFESTSSDDVNCAISQLLRALYRKEIIFGINWKRGDIWIINNDKCFHGKTFNQFLPNNPFRWLKRLRVHKQ